MRALRGVVLLAAGHGLGAAVVLLKLPGGVYALWPSLVLQGMSMGMGLGLGMVMAPLVFFVLAVLPVQHVGAAAGGLASMQQVGNSLGVADWRFFYATPVRQGYAEALCYPTLMATDGGGAVPLPGRAPIATASTCKSAVLIGLAVSGRLEGEGRFGTGGTDTPAIAQPHVAHSTRRASCA